MAAKKVAPAASEAAKPPSGAVKPTPAPPRYKGEVPPLPDWPISWSCVGMRLETLLTLDPESLVNKVNELRPAFSMAIVDADTMATEEMTVDPATELGLKLKAAKATGEISWLNPQLLSEVLEARSILDRDDEHRKEAQRRIAAAETCKKNIEEALTKEAEAKQQFEESLIQMKNFEEKMKEQEAAEQKPRVVPAAAAARTPAVPAKGKPPAKAPAKGAPPSTSALSSEEERKALEDKTAELRTFLQCFEKKVKIAQYWDVKGDSEKNDPLTTTRIYWCLGFGDTAETLSQQATVKNIFQAIFNLAKKPPPLLHPSGKEALLDQCPTAEQTPIPKAPSAAPASALSAEPSAPAKPVPTTPFIQELLALARASRPDHPSRKVPVIDVFYEDPPPKEESMIEAAPAPAKKPAEPTGLPYEQVAKAVAEASVFLKQQTKAFALLEARVIERCMIPEANSVNDVDMTYYKALLDEVPANLVSMPVLLHCMVEQVAVYDCPLEDLEALEVAKANNRLAKGLDSTFQKLGHGLSCVRKDSDVIADLMERLETQAAEEVSRKVMEAAKLAAEEARTKAAVDDSKLTSTAFGNALVSGKKLDTRTEGDKILSKIGSALTDQQLSTQVGSMSHDAKLSALGDAVGDDMSQISELSEGSSTKTQEGEEHLMVAHEFGRVGRLELKVKQQVLEFWHSVDAVNVERHMLSILGYPGKRRAWMPITPFLSEQKRCACLEALKLFASGGPQLDSQETYPMYKTLDDIYGPPVLLEILEDPEGPKFELVPVNLAAVRRYRKLKMFQEMLLKEVRKAFHIPDTPKNITPPKSHCDDEPEDSLFEPDDGLTEVERRELEKEKYLVDCGCPGVKIYRFPTPPLEPDPSVSSLSSKPSDMFLPFQKIIDRRMIESLPDSLLGEIYSRARIHLPYRARRYDRDEDCILEALYADERDHQWEGTVPSQMGFGDFVAHRNCTSPSMRVDTKHATYDIDERDGTILERFRCHLTEEQGLVWAGLPAKTSIQWEPQTTVIKDGNMILLRDYGLNNKSGLPTMKSVIAILRDGVVVCFFIAADGTMSMQITNSESQTIEITSKGAVLMFSSHLHAKVEGTEDSETGEEPPAEGEAGNGTFKSHAKAAPPAATGAESAPEIEGTELKKDLTISNIETIRDVLLQEKGDVEAWRCVLPSGTVVRYKCNGDAQVLCRQGNVSDWWNDFEGVPAG